MDRPHDHIIEDRPVMAGQAGTVSRASWLCAGDGQLAVLRWLAEHFRHLASELGQLVQERDAVVGQSYFARLRDGAAAGEAGVGDGVMRGAEGTGGDEGGVGGQQGGTWPVGYSRPRLG
jgi:hypothetical protein